MKLAECVRLLLRVTRGRGCQDVPRQRCGPEACPQRSEQKPTWARRRTIIRLLHVVRPAVRQRGHGMQTDNDRTKFQRCTPHSAAPKQTLTPRSSGAFLRRSCSCPRNRCARGSASSPVRRRRAPPDHMAGRRSTRSSCARARGYQARGARRPGRTASGCSSPGRSGSVSSRARSGGASRTASRGTGPSCG